MDLSNQEIQRQVALIRSTVEGMARGDGDLARCADAGLAFDSLRDQYRQRPDSLADNVAELAQLRKRFDELVRSRTREIADRYAAIAEDLRRLDQEKSFWRGVLIDLARTSGSGRVDGTEATVRVKTTRTWRPPPARSGERSELEEILRESGVWEAVSQLSTPKLKACLARATLPPPVAEIVERLCRTETIHQVSCRRRSGPSPEPVEPF